MQQSTFGAATSIPACRTARSARYCRVLWQLFKPPDGAGPQFVREAYEAMIAAQEVQPTFCKHPAKIPGGITNVAWSFDDDIDLDYHLRRSALPSPGRVRELLELTSRLHGSLLDRHRPLWEAHLVEGLNDGRFAVYVKFHHALIDGVSALKLMQRALTADPTNTDTKAPWALHPGTETATRRTSRDWPGSLTLRVRWRPSAQGTSATGLRGLWCGTRGRGPR